jgi:hypothetical protein
LSNELVEFEGESPPSIVAGLGGEQLTVEGGEVEDSGEFVVLEEAEERAEAEPDVGVVGPGGLNGEQAAEAGDAVILAVGGAGADEAAVLGNEQEQETIDEAEKLPVELCGGKSGTPLPGPLPFGRGEGGAQMAKLRPSTS